MTRTDGRRIDVVVVHTMEIAEGPDAAEACARWFQAPESQVSAHYCVDADSIVQCVLEQDIAWHARGGNANSVGIELAGFARQGPGEWNDAASRAVLDRAARLTARLCVRHGIPVVWLSADDLLAGRRGLTGHVQVSEAYGRSDHWDPGPAFPVERFLALVRKASKRMAGRSATSGV